MALKYQMVAQSLRQAILDGAYRDTMLLPTEQALCESFQVSRQTVRQALSLLASEGLIQRRQGSGSHIRDLSLPEPILITGGIFSFYMSFFITYFPTKFINS